MGIDPASGRIWFGRKALDIARQMRAEGIDLPFYCMRVGSDFYGRKGGRRCPTSCEPDGDPRLPTYLSVMQAA